MLAVAPACKGDEEAGVTTVGGTGTAGSGGVGGSATGGHGGGTAGAGECLVADGPTDGAVGGACDSSRCAGLCSLASITCNLLWQNARFSVFQAMRDCIEGTSDFCSDQAATIAACEASVFPRACVAAGAIVGGVEVDCADVAASCPDLSERDCSVLMSILKEEKREAAHACFLGSALDTEDCTSTLRSCAGLPE